MGQLFFDEECIYDISKPYLKFVTDGRTVSRTEGLTDSNMPLKLFQSWGHNEPQLENSNNVAFWQVSTQTKACAASFLS